MKQDTKHDREIEAVSFHQSAKTHHRGKISKEQLARKRQVKKIFTTRVFLRNLEAEKGTNISAEVIPNGSD